MSGLLRLFHVVTEPQNSKLGSIFIKNFCQICGKPDICQQNFPPKFPQNRIFFSLNLTLKILRNLSFFHNLPEALVCSYTCHFWPMKHQPLGHVIWQSVCSYTNLFCSMCLKLSDFGSKKASKYKTPLEFGVRQSTFGRPSYQFTSKKMTKTKTKYDGKATDLSTVTIHTPHKNCTLNTLGESSTLVKRKSERM